jgi:hypothetical protein
MKTVFKFLIVILFFSVSTTTFSQDIIRKRNNEEIKAKVIEIGLEEIKYKPFNVPDAPIIVISKDEVKEVLFENGSLFKIAPDPYSLNADIEVRNKTHKIGIEFLQPVRNTLAFTYESMIKVGMNMEFKAGIIGVGTVQTDDPSKGMYVKAGLKLLKSPDEYIRGGKRLHPLKGAYIKPEFIFNSFTTTYNNSSRSIVSSTYVNYAFDVVFGKQTLFGKCITFDYYLGIGYGKQIATHKESSSYQPPPYYTMFQNYEDKPFASACYSHLYLGRDVPLIFSAGITFGFIF